MLIVVLAAIVEFMGDVVELTEMVVLEAIAAVVVVDVVVVVVGGRVGLVISSFMLLTAEILGRRTNCAMAGGTASRAVPEFTTVTVMGRRVREGRGAGPSDPSTLHSGVDPVTDISSLGLRNVKNIVVYDILLQISEHHLDDCWQLR